jgi:hypothetical protein
MLWDDHEGTRCMARARRHAAKRWEVRLIRESRVLRRSLCRCFVHALRVAHAWRTEYLSDACTRAPLPTRTCAPTLAGLTIVPAKR